MHDPAFADLPALDALGGELDAAFARAEAGQQVRGGARRPPWPAWRGARPIVLAVLLALLIATAAAATTLLVLRGSPIPAPDPRDVAPEQTPAPGTARLVDLRAEDPGGGPAWGIRLSRSRTGLVCSTVGQIVDAEFGLIGLDGRFRSIPERIVDSCGEPRRNAASLVGARVFDARRRADVRTVVSGVAGDELRRVTVEEGGGPSRELAIGDDGTFLGVLRGLPEDLQIVVTLSFADGHTESHPFGRARGVVPDPGGGRAWKVQAVEITGDARICVHFEPARALGIPTISPAACGVQRGEMRPLGYFFAIRRITPGTGGVPVDLTGEGNWRNHPPRTAVWGRAGDDVVRLTVVGPGGERRDAPLDYGGSFAVIFGGDVDPRELTVEVELEGGRVATHRGSANLVDRPVPVRRGP
jgi:hypothetical protein